MEGKMSEKGTFAWAMEQVFHNGGKKVTRRDGIPGWYLEEYEGYCVEYSDYKKYKKEYCPTAGDVNATDWEVYDEEKDA